MLKHLPKRKKVLPPVKEVDKKMLMVSSLIFAQVLPTLAVLNNAGKKLFIFIQELECHIRLALQFGTPVPREKETHSSSNLSLSLGTAVRPQKQKMVPQFHKDKKVGTPVPLNQKKLALQFRNN